MITIQRIETLIIYWNKSKLWCNYIQLKVKKKKSLVIFTREMWDKKCSTQSLNSVGLFIHIKTGTFYESHVT